MRGRLIKIISLHKSQNPKSKKFYTLLFRMENGTSARTYIDTICNPNLEGNGYCAEHSTGVSAYLDNQMKKETGKKCPACGKDIGMSDLCVSTCLNCNNRLD